MKIEQERKIKSIESKFLKLSKNDDVYLTSVSHNCNSGFFNCSSTNSFEVDMKLLDDDLGEITIRISTKTPEQYENVGAILDMLQGSV